MKRTLATNLSYLLVAAGAVLIANVWCANQRQQETQQQLERQLQTTTTLPPVSVLPPAQTTIPPAPTTTTTVPPTLNLGEPLGTIRIPAIDVTQIVVYGIGEAELEGGPGMYPYTPAPWEGGNTAIAAHRTTNGAPFNRLDQLEPGDVISFDTVNGAFTYVVSGTQIVDATDMTPVADFRDNRITLTACHPKGSARQRIVVTAHQTKEETT